MFALTRRAVSDASCLIALDNVNRLHLLQNLFDEVVVPTEVAREFGAFLPWLRIGNAIDRQLIVSLRLRLGQGESGAIALAAELGDAVVILDDMKARRVARQMELRVIGTAGVLIYAKRKGLLPRIKPVLQELAEAGFFLSEHATTDALRLAGED